MSFAFSISWVSVLLAAVASFVVGWAWFSQRLFGATWLREMGMTKATTERAKKKSMLVTMIAGFVAQVVMAAVLAMIISATGSVGIKEGVVSAFWVWLGFVATISFGSILWEHKSITFFLINVTYWLVALILQGAIIGYWM